jgi:GntR family transcriptional regulator
MDAILPIYFQIKQTIRAWIINREYLPGDKIPSETELMAHFKVSRLTVRRAVSQLVQEGFLISKRGEGSFVSHDEKLINSFSPELRVFIDKNFTTNLNLETQSVTMARITAPKLIHQKLELDDGHCDVIQIKRTRFLRGVNFSFAINYIPAAIGERIVAGDLYKKSLTQIFIEELGVSLVESMQTIEASFADQECAEVLNVASGSPILFIEKIVYDREHKPVNVFQSSYRGDRCKFIIRFKNIRHRWVHKDKAKMGKG